MLGNDKFNQENYSIKSYFIERCKELANNQKAIRKSCKIRIAITISIVFIASKTFSQDKRYTYKVYDTYESKDTNTVDIKTINANENNRYFNFIGVVLNCSNEPIANAFWTLYKEDTIIVGAGRTDSTGKFESHCKTGSYSLRINESGCQKLDMKLQCKESMIYEVRIILYRKTGMRSTLYITNRKPNKKLIENTKKKNHNCKCGS